MGAQRNRITSSSAGFTLIELMIVLLVVAILVAIVVPAMNTAMEKSRQRRSMADMRTIGNQLQIYQNDFTSYPAGSLTIDQVADQLLPISNVPLPTQDAWHHDLGYASDGTTSYTVESYGRRGVPGANITPATSNDFDLDIVLSNGQFVAAVR